MSQYQNQYSAPEVTQTDEFGNPVRQTTTTYGATNPNPQHGTTGTDRGILGLGGHHHNKGEHHHGHGVGLHRAGSSSSSSSSEDEGTGKKKGLKEKLKEKVPGGGGHHKEYEGSQGTAYPQHDYDQHHEKKGVMDKIKEKLPGGGHH